MNCFDPRLTLIAQEARVRTPHVWHVICAMREMGKAFHIEAFAAFAGLEVRHVTAIIAALTAHNALPATKRDVVAKGTRMASSFTVPDDWQNWAVAERGWTLAEARQEALAFVDYWTAYSGRNGAKSDWLATWRNWCRRSSRPGVIAVPTSGLSPLEIAQRELNAAELLGRDYEAGIARRKIDALSNVVQFKVAG